MTGLWFSLQDQQFLETKTNIKWSDSRLDKRVSTKIRFRYSSFLVGNEECIFFNHDSSFYVEQIERRKYGMWFDYCFSSFNCDCLILNGEWYFPNRYREFSIRQSQQKWRESKIKQRKERGSLNGCPLLLLKTVLNWTSYLKLICWNNGQESKWGKKKKKSNDNVEY